MKYKIFWVAVAVFVLFAGGISVYSYQQRQPLLYRESLSVPAVTVDERTLDDGDLAYYIAVEELEIESQAKVYNFENPNEYWGIRIGFGRFIKPEAKQLILDTAVHDEIFYQMAKDDGFVLQEEEKERLALQQYDFWSDLTEEQRERLGVGKEDLMERMEEIAIAQRYQIVYGMEHSIVIEDYAVDGEKYQDLLKEHRVKVNKSQWKRIPFGEVILGSRGNSEDETE